MPRRPAHPSGESRSALRDYLHIPVGLWLRYLFQMVFALAYFAYFTNTSLLMAARGAGDSATTGVTTALSSIVGIGAGLLMPWLHRRLRTKLLPVMVLCMLLGVVVELRAYEAILFHGASFLIGFAYSVVMPYMVADVTHAAPGLNHTVTSSLFLAATSIGASASAVVLEGGAALLGLEGPEGQLCLGLMLLIVLLIAVLIASVRSGRCGHIERMRST